MARKNDQLHDIQSVADILRVSLNTARKLCESQVLPATNVCSGSKNHAWRVRQSDLDRFLDERANLSATFTREDLGEAIRLLRMVAQTLPGHR